MHSRIITGESNELIDIILSEGKLSLVHLVVDNYLILLSHRYVVNHFVVIRLCDC